MEQYGAGRSFLVSKAMDIFEDFIMESVVICNMVSLKIIKNDIKNYVKDSSVYWTLDKQVCLCYVVVYVFT